MPLQHGYALHDLGAALRDAGRREDAREPLRRALDVAERVGAAGRLTRKALVDVGARPRRAALSGSTRSRRPSAASPRSPSRG